ncbi:branched-chain amino acid aminotransferase [Sulfurimonas aquatica]|uniref:Branched-chain amino acid aminotransferase n=1 Tax=Sulfurimonas aquatica TaxID=2672570 RepID=A0A975B1M4_9BACT|nr:aminotransferase class IV family protein [Sulfurimonas aquatica]QSZ42539.1 branched-chain amino acid aminotransferase [Sulfurimonas aquatica]
MSRNYLETIKIVDGVVMNLLYHQRRLDTVLNLLNTTTIWNLQDLIKPPSSGVYKCRLLYNEKTINIEYIKYEKRSIKRLKLVYDNTIEYSIKYEDRKCLNELFKKREECDDILIVKNALITDTTIANIAFYDGSKWLTPKSPLLQGTVRQRLLEESKIIEKDIKVQDLKTFSKVALMNAMIDFDIIAKDNIEEIIC